MEKELQLHPSQANILRVLLFRPEARFAELNTLKLSNDHFVFHVKSLVTAGLVLKTEKGRYILSALGKEFANRLDVDRLEPQVEKQAKIGALVFATRRHLGKTEYLLQQRLKHPCFGYYGGVGGKVKIGETVVEAAHRELKEETGLSAKLVFCGVAHKMDYSLENVLLEDKFFFVFRATMLKGELINEFQGGRNVWLNLREIKKLDKLFPDVIDKLKLVEAGKVSFSEKKFSVSEF